MRRFKEDENAMVNVCALRLAAAICMKEFISFANQYKVAMSAARKLDKFMAGKTIENIVNGDSCETLTAQKNHYMEIAASKLFDLDDAFYKKEHQHIMRAYIEKSESELLMDEVDRAINDNVKTA